MAALAAAPLVGGCKKARGDDFDRYRVGERLEAPGAAPRVQLRYRPTPGADAVYQLKAWRRSGLGRVRARMHLRVALHLGDLQKDPSFALRLLTVLALSPEPEGDGLDLGPAHRVLGGQIGPRGALGGLEASRDLPSPVNLVLLAPLLLPSYPEGAVGPGARWVVHRRVTWSKEQSADPLVRRPRFHGRTQLLLDRRYTLAKHTQQGDHHLEELTLSIAGRLRSRTETLGHVTSHEGKLKGSGTVVVDRAAGLPEKVTLSLSGKYALLGDDQRKSVTETVGITLIRERE